MVVGQCNTNKITKVAFSFQCYIDSTDPHHSLIDQRYVPYFLLLFKFPVLRIPLYSLVGTYLNIILLKGGAHTSERTHTDLDRFHKADLAAASRGRSERNLTI